MKPVHHLSSYTHETLCYVLSSCSSDRIYSPNTQHCSLCLLALLLLLGERRSITRALPRVSFIVECFCHPLKPLGAGRGDWPTQLHPPSFTRASGGQHVSRWLPNSNRCYTGVGNDHKSHCLAVPQFPPPTTRTRVWTLGGAVCMDEDKVMHVCSGDPGLRICWNNMGSFVHSHRASNTIGVEAENGSGTVVLGPKWFLRREWRNLAKRVGCEHAPYLMRQHSVWW